MRYTGVDKVTRFVECGILGKDLDTVVRWCVCTFEEGCEPLMVNNALVGKSDRRRKSCSKPCYLEE